MIRMGVIGYGYWGPNIVRNFHTIDRVEVVRVCDRDAKALNKVRKAYPGLAVTEDMKDVLSAPDIDAVAIVTPVHSHYELARKALQNGKHVFVEKPFTSTSEQGEKLVELAAKKNRTIMVDHTFLFSGAVRKIKEIMDDNVLGDLYYFDSIRVNLGLFQHDVNVVWDLAPHDLSIMDYLLGEAPEAVISTGASHLNGHEDVAHLVCYFSNNVIAHINVNWLSPVKVRMTLIGGQKKMLLWNDLAPDEKIMIYDKGVEITNREGVYDLLISYRSGDMWAPRIDQVEALKTEAEYFADCVEGGHTPINGGAAGLRVVRMLEAANESLRKRGALVYL